MYIHTVYIYIDLYISQSITIINVIIAYMYISILLTFALDSLIFLLDILQSLLILPPL